MKPTHDGMTMEQRCFLQFWLEAHGWEEKYREMNGELPMPDYRWEEELNGRDWGCGPETMPNPDALLDGGAGVSE